MDKKELGRRVNIARKDRGLTSEKLSELCHINATYLRQIEAGKKSPSLEVLLTLCREMGVSPNYLLASELTPAEEDGVELLLQLYQKATPGQIKIITAMVSSALSVLNTDEKPASTPERGGGSFIERNSEQRDLAGIRHPREGSQCLELVNMGF